MLNISNLFRTSLRLGALVIGPLVLATTSCRAILLLQKTPSWVTFEFGTPRFIVSLPSMPKKGKVVVPVRESADKTTTQYEGRFGNVEWNVVSFRLRSPKSWTAEKSARGSLENLIAASKSSVVRKQYYSGEDNGVSHCFVQATCKRNGKQFLVGIHCLLKRDRLWRVMAISTKVTKSDVDIIYRTVVRADLR